MNYKKQFSLLIFLKLKRDAFHYILNFKSQLFAIDICISAGCDTMHQ